MHPVFKVGILDFLASYKNVIVVIFHSVADLGGGGV